MFYLDKSFYPTSEFIKPFNLRHENLFIPICFTAIFISNAFVYVVLFFIIRHGTEIGRYLKTTSALLPYYNVSVISFKLKLSVTFQ